MRHRVRGRKLGRTTAHRTAMFRNQLTALFTHERITTTVAKAKDLRPLAEKMVTMARTGSLANRRSVLEMVPDKAVVHRLFDDIAPRFANRPGGYTRILRLGRRHGDGAEMAIIEFVDYTPRAKDGSTGGGADKPSLMDRAKGLFGGGRQDVGDDKTAETKEAATEAEVELEADETTEPEPMSETPAGDDGEDEAVDVEVEPAHEKKADE